MATYHVLTAEVNGRLQTGLVCAEDIVGVNPAEFFLPRATNVEDHGEVEISGPAEHMLPNYLIEG